MIDLSTLRPATAEETAETLSLALRDNGRKRVHDAADATGRITAERLMQHLELSGFVMMKKAPASAQTATGHLPILPPR